MKTTRIYNRFLRISMWIIFIFLWCIIPVDAQIWSHPDVEALREIVLQYTQPESIISELQILENLALGAVIENHDGRTVEGEGVIFFAKWDGNNWKVYFEGTAEFRNQLSYIPETMLSPEKKLSLDYENSDLQITMPNESTLATGYKLPYPGGVSYYVSRAWTDEISGTACDHADSYAVDFLMPLNSTLVAARSGIVHYVEESRAICGCVNTNPGNYIVIRHVPDDGLYDYYYHIAQNGALVSVGATVVQGQTIALSHQIGYTCGSGTCTPGTCATACTPSAHLHFHIQNSAGQRVYTTFDDVGAIVGCRTYTSGNYYDTTPPVSSISLSGTAGENGWYKSSVVATITATDNSSGVSYTQYNLDGAGWVTYAAPVSINTDGSHILQYRSVDKAGNWETAKSVAVKIDTVAPAGVIWIMDGWETTYQTVVSMDTLAGDNTSGVALYQLRDAGGTWTGWLPHSMTSQWIIPAQTGQTYAVEAQYKDYAGNISLIYSDSIYLDIYPERPASQNYQLSKSTFGMGATDAQSANFQLQGTLSQVSAIGVAESDNYQAVSGYWSWISNLVQRFFNFLPFINK